MDSKRSKTAGVHKKSCKTFKKDVRLKIAFDKTKKGHERPFNKKPKGVIYISHIPHGFYEDQMREYFSQFGKVIATSVSRSKKTGRSKGYGFVEFDDEEVAKIAAESMNNYLMFNKIVKCRYIPPEERKGKIFFKPYIAGDYARKKNRIIDSTNKAKAFSNLDQTNYFKKTKNKINEFKKFFEEQGIEFNFKILPENPPDDPAIQERKTNSASESCLLSNDEASDEFAVLEIDESDHEISFETPPQVKKVFKKSLSSCTSTSTKLSNENSPARKKGKLINLKNSNVKRIKGGKRKKKNEKIKVNKKLLVKSTDSNKLKSSKNEISSSLKRKNPKLSRKSNFTSV